MQPSFTDRPILLEVFTDSTVENETLSIINVLMKSKKEQYKDAIKKIVGENTIHTVMKIVDKIR